MMQDNHPHQMSRIPLRLATCPVNWNNNDVPGWRPLTPFPEILDFMRGAGYRATEYDSSFGTNPERLRAEAAKRGIVWTGSYQWVDFLNADHQTDWMQDLLPTLLLLEAIDCRHLIVSDSLRPHRVAMAGRVPNNGSASLSKAEVQHIASGIHLLAKNAKKYGIDVHYHNHVGTWIEAPSELAFLLETLDLSIVDLCFDTGHYAYGGGNPADFISLHYDAIGYLHLKDVDTTTVAIARQRGMTFIDALRMHVFSPIGGGTADIPSIFNVLVDQRFDGWVVVEQDTCQGDSTETARDNLQFIESWFTENEASFSSGR